jgi:hypothetical protein
MIGWPTSVASPGPVRAAFGAGLRDVNRNRRYLLLVYGCALALAMPLALVLMSAIAGSLGTTLAGERMRAGFDSLWFNSFSAQATGVAATFHPSVVGIGAVLDALDSFLAGFESLVSGGAASGVLPVALLYMVLWSFFTGGFLARFAAPGREAPFLRDAVQWFPRMLAVTCLSAVFYLLMLGYVRSWVDIAVYSLSRESIDERVHFAWTAAAYLLLWTIVWCANLVFDYTKVLVVRGTAGVLWSPLHAMVIAIRFIGRHPLRTTGLYLLSGALWIAVLLLYWTLAPGAGTASVGAIVGAFLLGQLFILSRIWIRCVFYAAETALCGALEEGRPVRQAEAARL